MFIELRFFTSSCNNTRMPVVFGRVDEESLDSNFSSHIWVNNVHNASETLAEGRSGRIPFMTFEATAVSPFATKTLERPFEKLRTIATRPCRPNYLDCGCQESTRSGMGLTLNRHQPQCPGGGGHVRSIRASLKLNGFDRSQEDGGSRL